MLDYLLFTATGFVSGGVLYSYLIPLAFKHKDIRENTADKNPGTYNAVKSVGWPIGLLCLAMDLLKGFVPVFLAAKFLDTDSVYFIPVMAAPVFGHITAPFMKISGGKGIATTFGSLLGLIPHSYVVVFLIIWYVFFSAVLVIKPHFKRSLITFFMFSASVWVSVIYTRSYAVAGGCLLISAAVCLKHLKAERIAEKIPVPAATMEDPEKERAFGAAKN